MIVDEWGLLASRNWSYIVLCVTLEAEANCHLFMLLSSMTSQVFEAHSLQEERQHRLGKGCVVSWVGRW